MENAKRPTTCPLDLSSTSASTSIPFEWFPAVLQPVGSSTHASPFPCPPEPPPGVMGRDAAHRRLPLPPRGKGRDCTCSYVSRPSRSCIIACVLEQKTEGISPTGREWREMGEKMEWERGKKVGTDAEGCVPGVSRIPRRRRHCGAHVKYEKCICMSRFPPFSPFGFSPCKTRRSPRQSKT